MRTLGQHQPAVYWWLCRLGSSSIILTKRLEAGRVVPAVAVGAVVFDPGPPSRTLVAILRCSPDQR